MVSDNARLAQIVIIVLKLSIMNAAIYFAIGFLAGLLADSLG